MEKKSLKDAHTVSRPKDEKDEFVQHGSSGDKSTKKQISQSPKLKPVKVSFYWDPETERDMEQLRLRLLEKGRKLTRSEVAEELVKIATRNEKIIEELL